MDLSFNFNMNEGEMNFFGEPGNTNCFGCNMQNVSGSSQVVEKTLSKLFQTLVCSEYHDYLCQTHTRY